MTDKKKPPREIPETLTIPLKKTITVKEGPHETEYTEITLGEPSLAQLSQFIKRTQKENAVECMKQLIASVADIPPAALDKISVREYYAAQAYMTLFLTPPDEDDPAGNEEGSQ